MSFTGLRNLAASLMFLVVAAYALGQRASTPQFASTRNLPSRSISTMNQLAELSASDIQQFSYLGTSVAVSGNTVVVGAPGINDGQGDFVAGAAYVYVKPSTGWGNMTQVAKLTASDTGGTNGFGLSVAISGKTIVVNSNLPEIYVFEEPAGGWTNMNESAILSVSPIGLGPCLCGQLAIDGDTVIVGSPTDGLGNFGSIEVYVRPATGWQNTSQPNAALFQADAQYEEQSFRSVAISGGTVVGEGLVFSGSSAEYSVFLFTKPANGWNGDYTPQAVLSSTLALNFFGGGQVSISGNTVVTGSNSPNLTSFPPPFADVWVEPATGWTNMTETAQLRDGNTTFADGFGTSTGISGNRILIGTPYAFAIKTGADYRGAVYSFSKPASGWKTTTIPNGRLLNSDATNNDGFGLSLSAAGNTIVVGAPYGPNSSDNGKAYIY
jgi:FG-GAP repeat